LWIDLTIPGEEWSGYIFRLDFGSLGDLTAVEIRRSGKAQALSAHRLQRVPLGALERAARRHIRSVLNPFLEHLGPGSPTRQRIQEIVRAGRPIQQGDGERQLRLALLALRYVETLGTPTQAETLANEFSYEVSSIPKLIAAARNEYHFLTPTSKGRPGGEVTPRAYSLLIDATIRRNSAALSDEEREALEAQRAAARASHERLKAGEITPEQWEQETFGRVFPRDASGNIYLDFDREDEK
jgi:hypothetical protein